METYINGYMTRKQLAEYFKVNPATIHRWKCSLGMPYHKLATGRIVYNLEEVERWMLEKGKDK